MVVESWLWALSAGMGALLLCMAHLSALETAIHSARRSRLAQLLPEKRAARVESFLNSPEQFQSSALLAKSLCEAGTYAGSALVGLLLGVGRTSSGSLETLLEEGWGGLLGAVLLAFFVVVLLGQTIPKALATSNPELILNRSLGFIQAFTLAWTPILHFTRRAGRMLALTAGADSALSSRAAHSEEEIKLLVEDSAEEGVLEEEEKEMIHSVIEFTDTVARQVMVPRTDVDCLRADATLEDGVRMAMESGHSRLLVYEGTLDHVVGTIHVKELLPHLMTGDRSIPVSQVMRKPFFVPESKKLDELLREFRSARSQIAVVVDEFGGTSGLVTLEDVVEEIVGEIEDEYDDEAQPTAEFSQEHGILADARLPLGDANEQLGLAIPEGQYDTLGGFVFGLFGRPPEPGEEAELDGIRFVVAEMDGLRIRRVRILHPEGAADSSETE